MVSMNITGGSYMESGGEVDEGNERAADAYNNWSSVSAVDDSISSLAGDDAGASTTPTRAELYVVMGILTVLSLTGTGGNALVMYVFSQKKDKLVSTLFILVLALVDFVTCLVVIPYTIYMEYVSFQVSSDFVCKLYQFLITSNIPFSAFIMVAIAVDRYLCICHPFLRAMTVLRAKLAVAGLALLAAGIGVCVSLMYGVHVKEVPSSLETVNSSISSAVNWQQPSTDGISFDAAYGDFEADTSSFQVFGRAYSEGPDVERNSYDGSTVYTGSCDPNELVVSTYFQLTFQKCYTALYLLCLIVVAVLYVLIYRSVLDRRTRRQQAKSKSLSLVLATGQCRRQSCADGEDTLFTTVEIEGATEQHQQKQRNGGRHGKVRGRDERDQARTSISIATKRDLNRMANLKTAAMLFVVTVVFVVTFLPAFLMALFLIPYNMTIFYMYFANNVANPVIYSFMNKNFRDDTKRLLCR